MVRDIRDNISVETENMTFLELKAYINKQSPQPQGVGNKLNIKIGIVTKSKKISIAAFFLFIVYRVVSSFKLPHNVLCLLRAGLLELRPVPHTNTKL